MTMDQVLVNVTLGKLPVSNFSITFISLFPGSSVSKFNNYVN